MNIAVTIAQVLIALAIFNVWLIRKNRSTDYRGKNAGSMKEEFAAYGLPAWFMVVIGITKVSLAIALIVGIWFPEVTRPAAITMAALMVGALIMHLKVNDPFKRSLPALGMLLLSGFVAAFS